MLLVWSVQICDHGPCLAASENVVNHNHANTEVNFLLGNF